MLARSWPSPWSARGPGRWPPGAWPGTPGPCCWRCPRTTRPAVDVITGLGPGLPGDPQPGCRDDLAGRGDQGDQAAGGPGRTRAVGAQYDRRRRRGKRSFAAAGRRSRPGRPAGRCHHSAGSGPARRSHGPARGTPPPGHRRSGREAQRRLVHRGSVSRQSASQAASRRRPSAPWASRPAQSSREPRPMGASTTASTAWARTWEG